MSEEKTIEQLQKELEALKKENLEREISLEKAKIEAEEAKKKKEEEDKLREQLREEERSKIMEEMGEKSNIAKPKSEEGEKQEFKGEIVKNAIALMNNDLKKRGRYSEENKVVGKSYEEMLKDLKYKRRYGGF